MYYNRDIKLLITTLGVSWQIVPELLGFTNPQKYDFFKENADVEYLRKSENIVPIDECWIVTTDNNQDIPKLLAWATTWDITLKIVICKGVFEFKNNTEIKKMRSLIYRTVYTGIQHATTVYLSLSGGRKTMSADMQEAGNLFGCTAMLHVIDIKSIPPALREDTLCDNNVGQYANDFLPILINKNIEQSLIVFEAFNENDLLKMHGDTKLLIDDDGSMADKIIELKNQSSHLYSNFYSNITLKKTGSGLFKKLYFLHPQKLKKLAQYRIAENIEQSRKLLSKLPKAELHSHLGGVLNTQEIIDIAIEYMQTDDYQRPDNSTWIKTIEKAVALKDFALLKKKAEILLKKKRDAQSIKDFKNYYNEFITFISLFEKTPKFFDSFVFGQYVDSEHYFNIGIDPYQQLGDFQGSSLLQTKVAIRKTLEFYAKKLIAENVSYVEIRCSPYKYTKLGLTASDVVDCIIDTLKNYEKELTYRIICIIGREAKQVQINESIQQIIQLKEINKQFKAKFVGVDLAGNESRTNPATLRESFMPFLRDCIHITIHAGETEPAQNVWEAVYHLSADRIGHGLTLKDHPDLMGRFIDKNIGIEMCPSSNHQIVGFGNKQYPLGEYLKAGLKVTVNTDNMGISRTSLTDEFIQAAKLCPELTIWDAIVMIRNSLSIAFIDRNDKTKQMQKFENKIFEILIKELTD